jgi:hypothetical protein
MSASKILLPLGLIAVSACVAPPEVEVAPTLSPQQQQMQEVVSLAGPFQDVSTAVLNLDDNCFYYTHVGPVETIQLALRTPNGSPICSAPPATEETPVAGAA